MKPGNRVLKALKGENSDRPPFICPGGMISMMTVEAMKKLSADWLRCHRDAREMSRLALGVQALTGIENLGVPFCITVEAEAMGTSLDMRSRESEPRVASYALNKLDKWSTLPKLSEGNGRLGTVAEVINILSTCGQPYPVIANLTGPVSLAMSLVEPMALYKAMGKEQTLVHEFMQFLSENLIDFARLMLQAGAQILTISDPSASGEILGHHCFVEFALQYINRILDALLKNYKASIVHICGNLKPVYTDLNKLRTRAISIDSATSITSMMKVLGENQVIVGNVGTQLLMNGTPQQVKRASLVCLKRGASVLSPSCGISPFTPLANMQAMAESVLSACSTESE